MESVLKLFRSSNELPAGLKCEDVAAFLGISRATAYNLINSEGFPIIRIGKRIVVPKEAFLQWIKENTGKKLEGAV